MDQRTPYRPLAEALLSVSRGSKLELSPAVSALLGRPVGAADAGGLSPVVLAEALLQLFASVAPSGLVLILEDLHWADPDTVAVVEYLAEHGHEVGLGLVVSTRPPIPEVAHRVGDLLELPRLDPDQVTAMAQACALDHGLTAAEQRSILSAEGLPLLVEDLLAVPSGRSARFADLVRQRVARLDGDARGLLEVAAVLGDVVLLEILTACSDLPPDVFADSVRDLALADLLTPVAGRVSFRHALTRDAVLDQLSPSRRRELSVRVAEVLERESAEPSVVAALWEASGDLERAMSALMKGGIAAAARGALATAEQLMRHGHHLSHPATVRRADFTIGLARVLYDSGQFPALLKQEGTFAAEVSSNGGLAELRLLLARAALAVGAHHDARRHTDAARRAAADVSGVVAEVAVVDAQIALAASDPGRVAAAEHLAGQAIGLARVAGRPDLECEALETASLCARTRDLDAAERELTQALVVANRPGLGTLRIKFLNELGAIEMLRDARGDYLDQALEQAMSSGALGIAAGVLCNLASLHTMTAQWELAVPRIKEAGDLAGRLGMLPLQAAALTLEGVLHACRGNRPRMERSLREAAGLLAVDSDLSAMADLAVGVLSLVEEDQVLAATAFDRARRAGGVARTLDAPSGPGMLLACLRGDAGEAMVQASRAQLVRGARWGELWQNCAEAVVRGPTDPVGAEAHRSAAARAGEPTPVFTTLAMRLVAEAAVRDGWGDPGSWLSETERTAADLGLPRVAAACRTMLQRTGVSPVRLRGDDLLVPDALRARGVTAREVEVLDLVADRLQNREIAGRLFLSPRTVEKHVASLLQKCGVPNRSALAALGRDARTGRLD